jgi:hypothetical protein
VYKIVLCSNYIITGLSAVRNVDITIEIYSKLSRLRCFDSAALVLERLSNLADFVLVIGPMGRKIIAI